jgi:hypothetical protein
MLYDVYILGREKPDRKILRRGKAQAGRQDKAGAAATDNLPGALRAAAKHPPSFQRRIK